MVEHKTEEIEAIEMSSESDDLEILVQELPSFELALVQGHGEEGASWEANKGWVGQNC